MKHKRKMFTVLNWELRSKTILITISESSSNQLAKTGIIVMEIAWYFNARK